MHSFGGDQIDPAGQELYSQALSDARDVLSTVHAHVGIGKLSKDHLNTSLASVMTFSGTTLGSYLGKVNSITLELQRLQLDAQT